MLSSRYHHLTSLLLVLAYSAASCLSGLLHDHAGHDSFVHDGHVHGSSAQASCDHDHDCAHADDNELAINGSLDDAQFAHDDDCVVCRFVGQRVVETKTCELDRSYELIVGLAVAHPSQPSAPVARTLHSRAPPLLG